MLVADKARFRPQPCYTDNWPATVYREQMKMCVSIRTVYREQMKSKDTT